MTDIRQSPQYARFMQSIGWRVLQINSTHIYLKKIPFLSNYVKIPRPNHRLSLEKVNNLIEKHGFFQIKISPNIEDMSIKSTVKVASYNKSGYKIDKDPFLPTATIRIDLSCKKQKLFNSLKSAKRRGVRKACKLGVRIKQTDQIDLFTKLLRRQYFPLGMFFENETYKLWQNFHPKNASLLLALNCKGKPVSGVLLLYFKKISYYWLAFSLSAGKKLNAPTLLVWKAICISKKRGVNFFDLEGIYDRRYPKKNLSWKGFSKFKEGFGGKKIFFPPSYVKNRYF